MPSAADRDAVRPGRTTHGRFPAHIEAIHVPGVWMQTHHVEEEYYERFFQHGLTDAHRGHGTAWHA